MYPVILASIVYTLAILGGASYLALVIGMIIDR